MDPKRRVALSLVSKLASPSPQLQKQGVCELRLLTKCDMDSCTAIASLGALPLLLNLLSSFDPQTQENSITSLLNLSICPPNRPLIVHSPNSMNSILLCLTTGFTMETRENSAALLFSLMVDESLRPIIGHTPGLIHALLDLARSGSPRARKDALRALFHVSLCPDNRPLVVGADAIPVLVSLLLQTLPDVVEDALAVLAQVFACVESVQVVRKVCALPMLIDLLNTGSPRAQENSASALLNLCKSGGAEVVEELLDSSSCLTSLSVLMSTGSSRAKNKASSLMQILVSEGQ